MSSWRFCPQCGSPLEWGEMAGAERQLCFAPGCGFVRWDNPLPVVAAVIECVDRDGAILLARNHAWPDKMFALVTGFLERGETPEAAVAREVMEEVALEAVQHVDHALEAMLLELLAGLARAVAAATDAHDGPALVELAHAVGELAHRDVHGGRRVPGHPLVVLAHEIAVSETRAP